MAKIRFQLDENVPHAVAKAPRRRGIDVSTVDQAGLLGAPDPELLSRASSERRVLVTHDGDFLRLHRQDYRHAGIVYRRQGTRTIGDMVASAASGRGSGVSPEKIPFLRGAGRGDSRIGPPDLALVWC